MSLDTCPFHFLPTHHYKVDNNETLFLSLVPDFIGVSRKIVKGPPDVETNIKCGIDDSKTGSMDIFLDFLSDRIQS